MLNYKPKSRMYRKILHEKCQRQSLEEHNRKKIKFKNDIEALQHSKKDDASDRKILLCVVVK